MLDTKARRALAKRLEAGCTQKSLARILDISQGAVSRWLAGASRPEAHLRVALEMLLGIPQADWLTPYEVKLLKRVDDEVRARAAA